MNEYRIWERELFGRKIIVEHGKMAKQSHGACFVRFADSAILATVNASEEPLPQAGFVPLTVEFQEKFYAAGKIPGGFVKREGKPSENAILSARLIDRPIRPLFPKGMSNEVQVIVTVLSADPNNPPDTIGIFASSLALNISPIPFEGMVAGVRVGYVDGEYIFFPTSEELERSELDIVVAGTKEAVTMVEGEAKEVSEEVMLEALMKAHEAIKQLVEFQEEIVSEFDVQKWELEVPEPPEGFLEAFESLLNDQEIVERMLIPGKKNKDRALKEYRNAAIEEMKEKFADKWTEDEFAENEHFLKEYYEEKVKHLMRRSIVERNLRMDGRKTTEIRPITCELDILPRTHGSALFTRGETQSLATVTLGAPIDEQIIDTLLEEGSKTFMLHYNFPPFSTGEVKRMRGPGRREIGHGHLAERALKNMIPPEEEFPYTIRVVSEILESNGSSSMATVCSGSLALMAAGVPIKRHVAGVAMGLIQEPDETVILTDILGNEDHYGDMDFKVAGTRDGITAFQMDVKVAGVSEEIMLEALYQAKEARMKILDLMYETISEPRKEISPYAPVIKVMTVPYEKIGEIIGPGGKVVKKLSTDYDARIFIDDVKCQVKIIGNDPEKVEKLMGVINAVISDVKEGQVFDGVISRIEPYGIFVEIAPGKTGLLHSSKFGGDMKEFIKTNNVGAHLKVEVTAIDNLGRIQLKRYGVELTEEQRRSRGRGSGRPSHYGNRRPNGHKKEGGKNQ